MELQRFQPNLPAEQEAQLQGAFGEEQLSHLRRWVLIYVRCLGSANQDTWLTNERE